MPFRNIRFTSVASGLMTLVALLVITSLSETVYAATGLIIDQPAGVVMKPQSGMLMEIAERITAKNPDLAITVLHAKGDGSFLTRSGSPANLDSFETLWIFQGDDVVQNTPLFFQRNRCGPSPMESEETQSRNSFNRRCGGPVRSTGIWTGQNETGYLR